MTRPGLLVFLPTMKEFEEGAEEAVSFVSLGSGVFTVGSVSTELGGASEVPPGSGKVESALGLFLEFSASMISV